jgi:hypothetical protein
VKERAYVRDAVQQAARLGLRSAGGHDHASRGDVDARARGRDRGGGRGATDSVTAVSSHTSMPQVCTCLWPCGIVHCPNVDLVLGTNTIERMNQPTGDRPDLGLT